MAAALDSALCDVCGRPLRPRQIAAGSRTCGALCAYRRRQNSRVEVEAGPFEEPDAEAQPVCGREACRLWIDGYGCTAELAARGGAHTLEQVARMFGLSRARIEQIEKKALRKLGRSPERRAALRELLELSQSVRRCGALAELQDGEEEGGRWLGSRGRRMREVAAEVRATLAGRR